MDEVYNLFRLPLHLVWKKELFMKQLNNKARNWKHNEARSKPCEGTKNEGRDD